MGRSKDPEKHRYWGAQLRAWQRSGLSQAEFCRRQGLRRRLFGFWKRTLTVGQPMQEVQDQPRFVAVTIRPGTEVAAPTSAPALAVVTGSGYRVEVGDSFVPQTLARLLATLERL